MKNTLQLNLRLSIKKLDILFNLIYKVIAVTLNYQIYFIIIIIYMQIVKLSY